MNKLKKYLKQFNCLIHNSFYLNSKYKPISKNNQSSILSVNRIIQQQNKNPSFVYQQSKKVCNTIVFLFKNINHKQQQSINQLKNLFKQIHISNFSSWKNLKQTSSNIQQILNSQSFKSNNHLIHKNCLISLLDILYSFNYSISLKQDSQFINNQIYPHHKSQIYDLCSENSLKFIQSVSKHSQIFQLTLNQQNKRFQDNLLQQIIKSSQKQKRYVQILVTNIIKNGVYYGLWSQRFLQNAQQILQSKGSLQMQYQGLLQTLNLNKKQFNGYLKDKWLDKQTNTQKDKTSTNIVTQMKVFNLLKQMDYNVKPNQLLFNFQVDCKIDPNYIIQYHGIHHYRTNYVFPLQTKRSKWKVEAFKNRGYKVFVVPFYQWKKLQTVFHKKAWLISNLQKQFFFT